MMELGPSHRFESPLLSEDHPPHRFLCFAGERLVQYQVDVTVCGNAGVYVRSAYYQCVQQSFEDVGAIEPEGPRVFAELLGR